ncbi:MAG: hypothetical protein KGZ35_07780 [Truepera sp.]|nr:hypothetical protein [Truepera sp.]
MKYVSAQGIQPWVLVGTGPEVVHFRGAGPGVTACYAHHALAEVILKAAEGWLNRVGGEGL